MTSGGAAVLTLNGCDNVGKTSALRWLAGAMRGAHLVGTIDRWHPGWARVAGEDGGGFARWWFAESSTAEHVELVAASHRARRAGSGPIALEDRGWPMLLATCAATAVVKDRLDPVRALEKVTTLAGPAPADRAETHILLRHTDTGPAQEARLALARDPHPPSGWYGDYQRALAEILDIQVERGGYDAVLVRGPDAILPVQRRLRAAATEHGFAVTPLPAATPSRVWVLGGMSESGKSTLGALLAREHGAARLKIGWLLEIAALRAGVPNPYTAWDEPEQATRLLEEILRFASANKAPLITVESAHRYEATAHLRRCFGEVCQVVFVDADPSTRRDRAVEDPASLAHRDAVKADRGADRIRELADVVVDNTQPRWALKLGAPALADTTTPDPAVPHTGTGTGPVPRRAWPVWTPVTEADWLRAAAAHLVDEHATLLLATGSTGRASWRPGWSDMDLLLVREQFPLEWLRTVPAALPEHPAGAKVGLTLLTTGEVAAGRVPPRVVHALRLAAATGDGVLHHNGPPVRCPSRQVDDQASRGELGLVLMTTRRLLAAPTPDIRQLHKHLVLLAKILLRADTAEDDPEVDDADTVLAAVATRLPHRALPGLPTVAEAAALADHDVPDPAGVRRLLIAVDTLVQHIDTMSRVLTWRAS